MIVPWFSGRTLEAQVASWQIVSRVGCGDGEKKGKRKKKGDWERLLHSLFPNPRGGGRSSS